MTKYLLPVMLYCSLHHPHTSNAATNYSTLHVIVTNGHYTSSISDIYSQEVASASRRRSL